MSGSATPQSNEQLEEHRSHKRFDDRPMNLNIGGKSYKTIDWSLGGFQILAYQGTAAIGDRLECIHLSPEGERRGTFDAEVAWIGEENRLGLKLVGINGMPLQ